LKLLPAGVIGIIVAAMFSATMAAISSDLNAIASVLTRDVYLRLVNPGSSERRLVRVGRLSTLILGGMVVALSLWIAFSQSQSLFHLMVTAFGVFLAPTLLPVLAGLTIRSLTWKGALTGFVSGLVIGITTFAVKTWYLPTLHNIPPDWANYTFEGISIFLNFAATAIGMWLGSVLPAKDANEMSRISSFFRALDTPISATEVRKQEHDPARGAVGAATLTVGLLLILASLFANSTQGRSIDASLGLILVGLGARFLYRARQRKGHPVIV
jgi:solute:Na+ symporter, SSS family